MYRGGEALLESTPHCQFRQLPETDDPTAQGEQPDEQPEGTDLSDRCWRDDDGVWMTDFPPPPNFDGDETREYGDYKYERECTPEEAELLDADEAAAEAEEQRENEDLRDAWFAML